MKESLLKYCAEENLSFDQDASLAEILAPQFQSYLDTRDVVNYLVQSDSIKPLLVHPEPIEVQQEPVVDQRQSSAVDGHSSVMSRQSMGQSKALDRSSQFTRDDPLHTKLSASMD